MASRGGQSVAHVMRVKKLYRHGLKLLMNWTVHRDLWIEKGNELRAQFEANRSVQGQMNIERLVRAGEQKLKEHAHPDPYKRECPPLTLGASPAPPRHRVSWHSPPDASSCHHGAPALAGKSPRTRAPGVLISCAPRQFRHRSGAPSISATPTTVKASAQTCAPRPRPPPHPSQLTTAGLVAGLRYTILHPLILRQRCGPLAGCVANEGAAAYRYLRLSVRSQSRRDGPRCRREDGQPTVGARARVPAATCERRVGVASLQSVYIYSQSRPYISRRCSDATSNELYSSRRARVGQQLARRAAATGRG